MFSINEYISKIHERYNPKVNTIEMAMQEVIAKYPEERTPELDERIAGILRDCREIGIHLKNKKEE